MDQISLDTAPSPVTPPQISLDTNQESTAPLPNEVITNRAAKATYGLGTDPMATENAIRNGGEGNFREQAASKKDYELATARKDAIWKYALNKGGPITTDEINSISDVTTGGQEFTHPRAVIESEFSKKFVATLNNDVGKGGWYDDYMAQAPAETQASSAMSERLSTQRQILMTARENAEAALEGQSYLGRVADIGKNLLTLGVYGEVKQRGNIPGADFFSGLGTNREQQSNILSRMPTDKFTTAVTSITDKMAKDNPAQAVEWIDSMLGMQDKLLNNLSTVATFATLPGVGSVAKFGLKGSGMLATAAKDMVVGTSSTQPIKVAANVAAGNIKEAGIQKSTAEVVSDLTGTGNPTKQAVDGLHDILKTHEEAVAANPGKGPGAQETTNRIVAAYQKANNNLLNMIANFQRGSRVPEALASENSVRLLLDSIKDDYRGVSSRIVDQKGPVPDKLTGVLWVENQIGKYDGSLFDSPENAAVAAATDGITLKGAADASRQLELQRLLAQTQYELDTARAAQRLSKKGGDAASELRAKLGISGGTKSPEFDVNLKKLETNFGAYRDELSKLRALPGATIEQQGNKFYISKHDPIPETGKVMRSLLNKTAQGKPPSGFVSSFVAKFRTGEETTSEDNMAVAKQALYGTNKLLALAKAELEPFQKLNNWTFPFTKRREQANRLNDVLKAGRTEGMFKNVGEMQDYYLRHYNELPTDREAQAYFAAARYGQLQDFFTSAAMFGDESRLGVKMHSIQTLDANGNPTSSGFFKAIRRAEAPANDEGILAMGGRLGDERIMKGFSKEQRDGIKKGELKLLEIVYHNENPLQNFGDKIGLNHVKYVVTPSAEEAPLQMTKIDKNGGGLWDLDYNHYVKQAKMVFDEASKTWRYKGDVTVMPFQNGALGKNIVKLLEEVRGHLANKDEVAAQLAAKKLPIEYSEFKTWFEPKTTPEGRVIPPKLDVTQPFRLVPGNKTTVSMDDALSKQYGGKFRDDTKGNLIHQGLIKNGEHDNYELFTIKDEGHRNNPLYKREEAEYLDPVPSMNRAMRRIIDSTYMSDYKLFAVEHWAQQAKEHLLASPQALANSPMYYFYHGEYRPGTPRDVIARLDDAKYKAQQIWGTPSKIETDLHAVSQHMADSIYSKFGPKMLPPSWAISLLTDGPSVVKSATYHAAIGLFAWPQFLVQNMTWATIMGIEGPTKAAQGAMGALFHQYSRLNPHAVDTLDNIASKFGWKPGEYKEAWTLGQNSGFFQVGSDHALMDNPYAVNVIKAGKEKILDAGSIFFREGEKNVRYGAWYTSYRKWRDLNPTGAATDKDLREILNRADLLSGNMSQASKSMLQRGPLSFTTQFLGYNLRMMELMTGKRLTAVERGRLLATYWGLFGVSAAGLAGYPLDSTLRKTFMDNGYTAEPGAFSTFFTEGVPAAMTQLATGKLYGFGSRFGSVGLDPIREALSGDKSMWQIAAGAPGSFLASTWKQTDGLRSGLLSIADTDEKTHFPLKATDVDMALKAMSSYNGISRYAAALHSGNWNQKNGDPLDMNVSALNATVMTMMGAQEQKHYNVQNYIEMGNARKDDQNKTEKAFMREIRNWSQAVHDGDYEQARDFGIRAKAILAKEDYPENMKGNLMSRTEKDVSQSISDRTKFEFYLGRNAPTSKKAPLAGAYTDILKGQQQ